MNITPYHAKYYAYELTKRSSSNDIQKLVGSLSDARVDLNPHQIDAALFAFNSPLSKGAILADEVGLGKTIEAGIILSQKWAERKRKLLIICPANLRKQWNQELLDKFYLPSQIQESKLFNQKIKAGKQNPFDQKELIICSFQFARAKENFIKAIDWDLIIIDEAHRLRNVYKTSNKTGRILKEALNPFRKILLTATPLQNSLLELYGLVSIIDEYTFGDLKSFKSQYQRLSDDQNFEELKKRLQPICKRTLRRQVLEYINFTNRFAIVEEFYPYEDETKLYELVSEYLRRPMVFALPRSQRQLMVLILRKLLASSSYAIYGTFESLINRLYALIAHSESLLINESFEDNYETFEEIQDEWQDEESEEEFVEELVFTPEEIKAIKEEIKELNEFKELAFSIRDNAKGDKLLTALEKGFEKLKELGANQKALIFTESRRTQDYLLKLLNNNGYEDKIVLFNGLNNDDKTKIIYKDWQIKHKGTDKITGSKTADVRQSIVDYFKNEATIMIATEAAAEGINLQFCSLVVNYDLPWNPQRIEQRIGRCHRYGQKYDVVVVNFLNRANAADQRVYQLLDEKFKLFSGVFGASDEVLGSIESGVDFEKRIVQIYQECRKPEEIQYAFDQLQRELEPDIEEKLDLTRKNLLENFDEEVHQKLKFSLEKGKEYLNQYEQWLWLITQFYLKDFANFDQSDDSFILHTNPFDNEKIHPGSYRLLRAGNEIKKSEIELKDDTNLYRIGHPLAQKIIWSCKEKHLDIKEVEFHYSKSNYLISVLKDLIGKSGWLEVSHLQISSFEIEDHVILTGLLDDGTTLDPEICKKIFIVDANEKETIKPPQSILKTLENLSDIQEGQILHKNMERNMKFFDEEYDKLDKWSDDMKLSLEKEIKDLDAEIKLRKSEARRLMDLQLKVKEQRLIKDLEKKRNEKRKNLFEAQDLIDSKKENLLSEIEIKMRQQHEIEQLFLIKWTLV